MKKIAILDLGTNTFHLLIVGITQNGTQQTLYKAKQFVKLAQESIHQLSPAAWKRAMSALAAYHQILTQEQILASNTYVLATEGLRKAKNSTDFITTVKQRFGLNIRIISGDLEANLIYYGIKSAVPLPTPPQKVMIMDIGGGSTEFIIADQEQVFWQQSFPLGVAVLKNQFHQQEPITASEIQLAQQHLHQILQPLFEASRQHPVQTLIGASGTFDTIRDIWFAQENKVYQQELYTPLNVNAVLQIGKQLLPLTFEQRLAVKGMAPQRAELMSVAYILLEFVIKKLPIQTIYQANYAMKEGMAYCVQHQIEVF